MSNNFCIHLKCNGQMYSLMLKPSVEEISMAVIQARIYKKVGLEESNVKLQLSYIPLLVGVVEEAFTISDDEDLWGYLTQVDKDNRRCVLLVEVICKSDLPIQVSRVGKSSCGKNYDEMHSNADVVRALVPFDKEQAKEHHEDVREHETQDDGTILSDPNVDDIMETSEQGDKYIEAPLMVVEPTQVIEPWEDGLDLSIHQEFPNKKAVQEVVDKAAFCNSFGYVIKKSDLERYVLSCSKEGCKWGLRAANIKKTEIFSIRRHKKMHTCSRASQSKSNYKRKGTPELVASLLHDDYPGELETPPPKTIIDLVQTKLGVKISYSTALRGKNQAVNDLRGSPEESYMMLYSYLYMLEKVNHGTKTSVKLDEEGRFKYLFIGLGASIEGFQVMRKVIIVDATFLKNGYGGVLIFASAQDPNRHHYPIAYGVLDSENDESWTWFFEMLKTVVADSSELVFMSDRNARLMNAIANVYPVAKHGHCIWHLSQNVKGHASNVNRDVVAWRFMECSRFYTEAEFNFAYSSFKTRYLSAAKYVEDTTVKEKWARYCFAGERYNLDITNCVESMNSVFKDARKYSLIPMLDTILKTFSAWFNKHRKDAVSGSILRNLVPVVENWLHDSWSDAEKLKVTELNSFELEYNVLGSDGKPYLVNLLLKTCTCRRFDIDKYPCVHAIAAFICFKGNEDRVRDFGIHELCSKYYWSELWAMSYYKTIYLVPDRSQWNVPDHIKELQIIPPKCKIKKGRKKVKRLPSAGERRPRTSNKRRPRQGLQWLIFGNRCGV